MTPTNCDRCGRPLEAPTGHRRARKWCSEACRKAAWRAAGGQAAVRAVSSVAPPSKGDRVSYLLGQRDLLWDLLDAAPMGAAAGISRELRQVLAELAAIDAAVAAKRPSMIDHLVERRQARRAGRPPPPCPPELHCHHAEPLDDR
jgi:hypothetical protein